MAAAPDNARQARPRPARRGVLGRGARGGAAAVGKAVGEARNAPQNTSNATPRIHSKWLENGTFIRSQLTPPQTDTCLSGVAPTWPFAPIYCQI